MATKSVTIVDKLDLLKGVDFFRNTPEKIMHELALVMRDVYVPRGESIIHKGEVDDRMFIVYDGKLKVHHDEHIIAEIGNGKVLGELALLDSGPRTMSVTALEDSQLFYITRTAFNSIFDESLAPVNSIIQVLIERLRSDSNVIIKEFQEKEQELKDLVNERTKELKEKNKELIRAQKFKEQFLANMSHEIRTPMNAVVGMTNLLLNTNTSQEQLDYLQAIKQAGSNLLVIINDILDFSKIEAGKLEIEKTDFSLDTVIEGLLNTMKFKAEEKGLALETRVDENMPDQLIGDPVRLNQILVNLTGNAVKFTDNGKITISCNLEDKDKSYAKILFSVTDTGIGIPRKKLGQIFESFSQADSNTTRIYGGTGLGLSITKQLVELQEGKISVESEEGKGTTFYFSLKYPIGKGKPIKGQETGKPKTKLKDVKILLAEDDDYNQIVAKNTLEYLIEGVTVDVVPNGAEAVEKAQQNHYDIVLMDVNMPIMDGYEATKNIRKLSSPAKSIKIMAMTASATKKELDKCLKVGMDTYISKPFEPQDLYNKIENLISK